MGSINHGLQSISATEKARGCVFNERFRSAAEVAKNNGVFSATPPTISNGIYIGGLNKAIEYGTNFQFESEFTVMAWVYWDGTTGAEKIIMSKGFGAGKTGLQFQLDTNGVPQCYTYQAATWGVYSSAGAIPSNTWTHIAAHRTNASGWKIFVNGVDKSVQLGASTAAPAKPVDRYFCIGGLDTSGAGASSRWWYGNLKQCMAFDKALSIEEIQAYYNDTMWKYMRNAVLVMDGRLRNYDPTNTRVLDVSGNGNHLTLGNGSTASTYPTKLTKIRYRSDGGDYLKTQNTNETSGTSNLSVFAVIKNTTFGTANRTIASKASAGTGNSWFLQVNSTNNDFQFRVYTNPSTFSTVSTSNNYSKGELVFLTGVFNGSTVKLYHKNGVSSAAIVGIVNPTLTPIYLFQDGYGNILPTDLMACYIFNIALNQMQILDLQLSINPNSTE